jgi:Alkylmercury lyase
MSALLRDVRRYIYEQLIETSAAPSAADVAQALSLQTPEVEAAFRALADARALVLRPGTTTIWMAMPFSNAQTPFTVISGGRAYYANCAWDAFGIAALLRADSRVLTTCADCGGAIERKIASGVLADPRGVVHFALPARRWWDDIGFT